jgi:site-specific DNA recombinase
MTIATGYVRVSTAAQGEDGSSLGTQEAAVRAFCAERGWTINESEFQRETHTGAELFERPALTRLRDAIKHKRINAVVCYSVDRLSRDPYHLALIITEAEHAGVQIHFVTETLDATPIGRLILQVQGFAAQMEREKIRERSIRGKRARLHSGKLFNYGTDLYGYRRDKEKGVRIIEEAEAAIVRQMFAWVAEDGCSIREVARRLRERAIPPPGTGKFAYSDPDADRQWGTSQVLRMLHNPAYKGESYALRYTADHHKAGRPDFRPVDEWLRLPDGLTPPIVTPATWGAAQGRLSTNTGDATRTARIPALLRGHIFCPRCGRRMYPEMDHGALRYRCGSRVALVRCAARQLTAAEVEPWAWAQVRAIILDPRLIDATIAERGKNDATTGMAKDRDAARRALARIEQQQRRLLENFGASDNPDFPWHLVEEKINQLQRDRARWQETLERSEAAFQAGREEGRGRRDLAEWCARVATNIETLTIEEKRLALAALGVRVVAEGRDTEAWRITFDPQ